MLYDLCDNKYKDIKIKLSDIQRMAFDNVEDMVVAIIELYNKKAVLLHFISY